MDWIKFSELPIRTKYETRKFASSAEKDLNTLLYVRATDTQSAVLKTNSLSTLGIDYKKCLGANCLYKALRVKIFRDGSVDAINPFQNNSTIILTINGVNITNAMLFTRYRDVDDGTNTLRQMAYGIASYISSLVTGTKASCNRTLWRPSSDTLVSETAYVYIQPSSTVSTIPTLSVSTPPDTKNYVFEWANNGNSIQGICRHSAGVGANCGNEKLTGGGEGSPAVPKSNIFINSNGLPCMLGNCNPYDCFKIDLYNQGVVDISLCMDVCPAQAIYYRLTGNQTKPTDDSDGTLKALHGVNFRGEPF